MSIGDATVDFEYPPGSILAEMNLFPVYNPPTINNNVNGTVSIAWIQGLSAGSMAADNITAVPALLGHLKIQMITLAESPNICFNVTGTNFDDQFFTACGPFAPGAAFANCGADPGIQIIDYDGSDCSGAIIPAGCAMKTWDGANWSPLGAPTATDNVVFMNDYTTGVDGSITACEITVDSGATLLISANDFLSVVNDITVDGTLSVEHTGNVVQIDDAALVTNNGTITVLVDTPALDGRDFMLMGSPMTTETRAGVFAGAMRVRNHLTGSFTLNTDVGAGSPGAGNWVDEEGDDWPVYLGSTINPGEGYMVMRDLVGPATALNLTYTQGTLNNGVITYAAGFNGTQNGSPNVIANPYASAMSATALISDNANVDAVYFWEHVTAPNAGTPGPYGLDYTMEDISVFNLTGGTQAAGSDAGTLPNGVISTGQGFGVKASAGGPISFNNAMRLTTGNTTLRNQDLDRIWLNVQSVGYELNSTALVGFIQEATDAVDIGYDAKRLATNVSLFSHLADGTDQLGIQARGLFFEEVKIPMGFATLIDEHMNYTISVQNIEGLNLGTATVYLIDKFANTSTNLSDENYTFESSKGIFDGRFTLQFTPESVLGLNDNALDNVAIYPNPTQNILHIVSSQADVTNIDIYDIRGRVVLAETFTNSGNVQIDLSELNSAIYFVEINTEAGKITKRILKE